MSKGDSVKLAGDSSVRSHKIEGIVGPRREAPEGADFESSRQGDGLLDRPEVG